MLKKSPIVVKESQCCVCMRRCVHEKTRACGFCGLHMASYVFSGD